MKHRMRKLQVAISLSVMLALVVVGLVSAAIPTVPDHFDTEDTAAVTISGSTFPQTATSSATIPGGMFGTERDLVASVDATTSGAGTLTVKTDDNSNSKLTVASADGMGFTVQVQWDGAADTTKSDVDSTVGLSVNGVDLTEGGTHDRFAFLVTSSDLGGTAKIRVYSDASHCSEGVFSIAGLITSGMSQRIYERRFAATGALSMPVCTTGGTFTGTADFVHARAVVLTLTTGTDVDVYGWDVALDLTLTAGSTLTQTYADFGDLDNTYEMYKAGATQVNAIHVDSGLYLGASMSSEQNKNGFTGIEDDLDNGITRNGLPWVAGSATGGSIRVTTTNCSSCYLVGFIDWNGDGDFWDVVAGTWDVLNGVSEAIFATPAHITGSPAYSDYTFPVPSSAIPVGGSTYYARFRLTDIEYPVSAWGAYSSGEVEDYLWAFGGTTAVDVAKFDATSPASPFLPLTALALPVGIGLLWMQQRRRK